MSFWQTINESILINVQKIKEATNIVQVKKDPVFQNAVSCLCEIEDHYNAFCEMVRNILATIEMVSDTGVMITKILPADSDENWTEFVNATTVMFSKMNELCKDQISKKCKFEFLDSLRNLQKKLQYLNTLKDKQNDLRLLVNNYEKDLERDPQKAADDRFVEQYKAKKDLLVLQTKEFIDEVNLLWNNRFRMIDEPMNNLIKNLYTYLRLTYFSLQEIHQKLPNENWDLEFTPQN